MLYHIKDGQLKIYMSSMEIICTNLVRLITFTCDFYTYVLLSFALLTVLTFT